MKESMPAAGQEQTLVNGGNWDAPSNSNLESVSMSYRTFSLLLGIASAAWGWWLFYSGVGPWWQILIMGFVGLLAPFLLAVLVWVAVIPDDAAGVAREFVQRLVACVRRGNNNG